MFYKEMSWPPPMLCSCEWVWQQTWYPEGNLDLGGPNLWSLWTRPARCCTGKETRWPIRTRVCRPSAVRRSLADPDTDPDRDPDRDPDTDLRSKSLSPLCVCVAALRHIILTSGTLLKDDIHKVTALIHRVAGGVKPLDHLTLTLKTGSVKPHQYFRMSVWEFEGTSSSTGSTFGGDVTILMWCHRPTKILLIGQRSRICFLTAKTFRHRSE